MSYTSPYFARSYGSSGKPAAKESGSGSAGAAAAAAGTSSGASKNLSSSSSINTSSSSDNRPSSLNLLCKPKPVISNSVLNNPPGAITSASSGSGNAMPNKPYRYAPNLPTIQSKSSSYTSLPSGGSSSHTGTGSGAFAATGTATTSPYNSVYHQRLQQQQQDVITVPPKSSNVSLGYGRASAANLSEQHQTIPYYQTQMTSLRAGGVQSGHSPNIMSGQGSTGNLSVIGGHGGSGVTASRSAHNLLDSIPDVFCLSCPPAEYKFSDAYRAKTLPRTGKENERLIGFATLPEQVHRKSVKKGFDFTLMVIGESGLGKSTLINSLFLADFYQNRKIPSVAEQMRRTTTIVKHQIEIEERGVKLRLTVVDTPGFGDAINCEDSWKPCIDHIDDQFQQYFQAESGLNRRHIQDTRIHCCLYFVPPYGRGLRALDIEVLRSLQNRVNVIPVIAKSDTLTPTEMKKLKDQILKDLRSNNIQIYQFPECDEEEDEEFKRQDRELKAAIPFAIASSDTFIEVAGRKIRGRQYPWGIVEVENPSHSDFAKLRTILIQSHMHDLKETTQDLHYENFRAKAIAQISQGGITRERSKLKRDASTPDSPQDILQQKEAEIKRMQQMISKMEAKLKAAGQKPSRTESHSVIDL